MSSQQPFSSSPAIQSPATQLPVTQSPATRSLATQRKTTAPVDLQSNPITSDTITLRHEIGTACLAVASQNQAELAATVAQLQQEIANRQRIEELFLENEARFQQLAASVPGMIYQYIRQVDGSDALLYVSPACQDIYGISLEKALESAGFMWERYPSDALQQVQALFAHSFETLEPFQVECQIITAQGQAKWVQISSRPEKHTDESVIWAGIVIDITEGRQIREALRQSEARFQKLTENVPGMIYQYVLSPDGSDALTYVSSACQDIYETPVEAVLQNADLLWQRIHPKDLQAVQRSITTSAETLEPWYAKYRILTSRGCLKWLQGNAHPTRQQDGSVLWDGIMVDITEYQQAEEALYQSEEHLRLVLQNMPVMMNVFDEKNNIIAWNQECERVTGYTAEEMINNPRAMELLYPDPDYLKLISTEWHQRGHDYRNWEWNVTCKDGTIKTIAWSNLSKRFPIPGWSSWSFGIDVSDRKKAEAEMLNALEQERQLNELKSQFVSMISHEFRTPLSTILSSTELLQRYDQRWPEEKRQLRLRRIVEAIDRMTKLLNDVLLVGKAEAGKLLPNPTPIDLVNFCHELLEEMQLSTKDQHLLKFIHTGYTGPVALDGQLLGHILGNLISNAIKYSPQGGEVHLRLFCEAQAVIFQVQDSGIGISAADQAELFTLFKRGNNVGTIPGTGLGLSIVKQCVDLQGGNVVVESELGQGTLITVTLPSMQTQQSHG